MVSQKQQILNHLQSGNSITALEALQKFGCFRLAARIRDLRNEGYTIQAKTTITGNRKNIAVYNLI